MKEEPTIFFYEILLVNLLYDILPFIVGMLVLLAIKIYKKKSTAIFFKETLLMFIILYLSSLALWIFEDNVIGLFKTSITRYYNPWIIGELISLLIVLLFAKHKYSIYVNR